MAEKAVTEEVVIRKPTKAIADVSPALRSPKEIEEVLPGWDVSEIREWSIYHAPIIWAVKALAKHEKWKSRVGNKPLAVADWAQWVKKNVPEGVLRTVLIVAFVKALYGYITTWRDLQREFRRHRARVPMRYVVELVRRLARWGVTIALPPFVARRVGV